MSHSPDRGTDHHMTERDEMSEDLDAKFDASCKAISDGIERRDATIAELTEALDDMLTASQPQHTFKHVFLEEAQEKARIALAKVRA